MNGNTSEETSTWQSVDRNFATIAIHSGFKSSGATGSPVVPPITLATTFEQDAPGQDRGFDYTRSGNPTRNVLEKTLAALDKGTHALCFSSGMGAIMNVIALLNTGEHVVCIDDAYGGTGRLIRNAENSSGITSDFVDYSDLIALKKVLKPETKLVWIETPTNPTLKIIDIAEVSDLVHSYSKDIIVAVDNTFLTSYYQRPLELGADLVVYSLTKYMNGHSDVLMGAVVTKRDDLHAKLRYLQNAIGAVPSPFDCYLVNRGLKTLHLRMPMHMHNSLTIAKFLESHPKIEKVLHPGLSSHPQNKLAMKQCAGHSGMISFYLKTGQSSPTKFLKNLKVFKLADSWGGVESLAKIPAMATYTQVPVGWRKNLENTDNLVRLSVGLETDVDLIGDLNQALESC